MPEEALLEDLESIDDDEDDESLREDDAEFLPFLPGGPGFPLPFPGLGGGRRRPSVAQRQMPYSTPGMTPFVTQTQFQSALARVRADVNKNATAIKQVDTRVSVESGVNKQQNAALGKQSNINKQQSKQIAAARRDIQKARDMSLMLLLLTRPKQTDPTTTTATIGGAGVPIGSRVLFEPKDSNTLLLSIMLMGGLGGNGMSGDGSNMLLFALALGGGL